MILSCETFGCRLRVVGSSLSRFRHLRRKGNYQKDITDIFFVFLKKKSYFDYTFIFFINILITKNI